MYCAHLALLVHIRPKFHQGLQCAEVGALRGMRKQRISRQISVDLLCRVSWDAQPILLQQTVLTMVACYACAAWLLTALTSAPFPTRKLIMATSLLLMACLSGVQFR